MDKDVALALLGLSENDLSDEKVEKAWQDALQVNHPALHNDDDELCAHAEEQCNRINEAHDVLVKELQESNTPENQISEIATQAEDDLASETTEPTEAPEDNEKEPRRLAFECVIESDTPLLDTWKTSVAFSIFGLIGGMILWSAINNTELFVVQQFFYVQENLFAARMFELLFILINFAIYCVYAARVYTSFFKKHPCLRSSLVISFLNFAVGGVIFGAI